ncbi:MAG TPA: M24 family metallopeptidase [Firmicutes bacterium]|nr:M24 family metallopeptidase [Bacillota bacterium]
MRERLRPGDVEVVELAWPEPEVTHDLPQIPGETYAQRLASLRALMDREGLSHVLVYGDREHFANTRWLTGYDPRFEESLVIVGLTGRPRLLVGLEGQYYAAIAQGVDVELYDEFSLQGQPSSGRTLPEILADCGLSVGSRVGLAGTKYRQTPAFAKAGLATDVPYYLVAVLAEVVGRENIRDVTRWFTDSSTGLRIPLTVDEIARNEMINQMVYAGMCAALSALNPGVSEAEISGKLGYDGSIPLSCHIVVSFGENVNLALNSPTNRQLRLGDPLSVAMGVWGANIARTGIAVHSAEEFPPEIADALEKVFVPYFDMLLRWYGALHVGANCGDVYEAVREYMEDPFFGIALNAGHLIRDEEWINAPFVPGSKDVLASGTMIQCDIIVPATPPYPGVHTEDGLVVADADLRAELAGKYPAVWERIQKRRAAMEDLGYKLHEDVLPLCDMQGQVTPFMLSPTKVLSLKK